MNKILFSERITETIKSSKFNQKQIAKILNISESNITNWKNGQNLPSVETLYRLCILLEESADYLLGLEDESGTKTYSKYHIENIHNNGNINMS